MLLLASQILHCWLKTSSFYSSKYSLPSSWQHPLEQVKVWPINILPGGMRTSPDPNRDKYKLLQKSLFPGKSKKLLSTTPAYSVLKRFPVFLCLNLHLFFTQIVWFLCRNLPVQEKREFGKTDSRNIQMLQLYSTETVLEASQHHPATHSLNVSGWTCERIYNG